MSAIQKKKKKLNQNVIERNWNDASDFQSEEVSAKGLGCIEVEI